MAQGTLFLAVTWVVWIVESIMKIGERGRGEGWEVEVGGQRRAEVELAGEVIGLQKNVECAKQEVESGTLNTNI